MKVKALVTVTVTIALDDTWGEYCQLDQVFRQAGEKARGIITQHLAAIKNVEVHREPKVEAVLTDNSA